MKRSGKDLREVVLLVGSGGALRHLAVDVAADVMRSSCGAHILGGWLLPREPKVAADHRDAALGLLAPMLEVDR